MASFEQPEEHPALPPHMRKILEQLRRRIRLMETALGNLHDAEAKSGVQRTRDKSEMRQQLTVYYLAREAIKRGHHVKAPALGDVLVRVKARMDHSSFSGRGPITRDAIGDVDFDRLGRELTGD